MVAWQERPGIGKSKTANPYPNLVPVSVKKFWIFGHAVGFAGGGGYRTGGGFRVSGFRVQENARVKSEVRRPKPAGCCE